MDRTPVNRGVPLSARRRATPHPRSGSDLRQHCRTPDACHGQPGQATAPASPWQNGCAERLIGSIRRECVNHFIVLGEAHLHFTSCEPTLIITMTSERTGHWIKMRRSLARSADRICQFTRDPAGFITITSGFGFSGTPGGAVGTAGFARMVERAGRRSQARLQGAPAHAEARLWVRAG